MRSGRRRIGKALRRLERLRFLGRPPSGLVLGYHRIAADPADPWRNCVSPAAFASHLEILRRVAEPVSLTSVARADGRHDGRPLVAVTFDDGYADFASRALPLLRRHQIPATVFVISGALGDPGFWWDRLAAIVADGSTTPGEVGDLHERLARLGPSERDILLAAHEAARRAPPAGGDRKDSGSDSKPMTRRELRAVAGDPHVEIGCHGFTHRPLSRLDPARLATEVAGARRELEEILGTAVTSFSYPHGRYSRTTLRAVREAGFERACTSTQAVVRAGEPRLALPRVWAPDREGRGFETWLRRWLPETRRMAT